VLRRRLKDLARDVERKLDDHEVDKLLMAIEGLGPLTAACLIAELGNPARFDSPGAIVSYVGVIPRIRQSGKKRFTKGPRSRWGTLACANRSSWWFYKWCGVTRGCGSTTNGSEPQANPAKLQSSPRCENCWSLCGAWRLTVDPSCR